MSEPPPVTAEIIAFPLRRSGPATDAGQERLQRALAALDEAVAGQRAAIAAWRGALANLSTGGLRPRRQPAPLSW